MQLYLTPDRYYAVTVQHDLFGQTVIVRSWGGRRSRLGGIATEPYSPDRMQQIDKERRAHGYTLV